MAQNLKINITAQDKTKQALSGVRGRLAGLKRAIFSVQGAFSGIRWWISYTIYCWNR